MRISKRAVNRVIVLTVILQLALHHLLHSVGRRFRSGGLLARALLRLQRVGQLHQLRLQTADLGRRMSGSEGQNVNYLSLSYLHAENVLDFAPAGALHQGLHLSNVELEL